ncbi:MAG: hypothetical protein ACRED5_13495 [Propylenella sp.]
MGTGDGSLQVTEQSSGSNPTVTVDRRQPPTLFGKQYAGRILTAGMILIFALFGVSLGYFVSGALPGTTLTIGSQTYVFLFLLLLSIALFLSVFIGEKSSVAIAGVTFVGSSGVLAGLLWVFSYFSDKLIAHYPPDFAYLTFQCDQQRADQKELVIKVEGSDDYLAFLAEKLNKPSRSPIFKSPDVHTYLALKGEYVITRSGNGFRVPIGFQYDHRLTVLPVDHESPDATAAADDAAAEQRPIMVINIPKMSGDALVPSVDALFDLNVAAYVCNRTLHDEISAREEERQ